ncbi:MAG: hypothetical protein C4308_11960 [Chitinophagaceae bacterium]
MQMPPVRFLLFSSVHVWNFVFGSFLVFVICTSSLVHCLFFIYIAGMRWILVLSRLAFVCNIFFLLAFSLQLTNWVGDEQLTSTIIIIGFVMSFLLNPVTNFVYLFFLIVSRTKLKIVPAWLIVANALFLVIDAFYLLHLNQR